MSDTKYNGWTNRATWLVNVWGNPESREDVQMLRADLEEQYDAIPNGIIKDMIDLDAINWDELEAAFEDEEEDKDEDEDSDPTPTETISAPDPADMMRDEQVDAMRYKR